MIDPSLRRPGRFDREIEIGFLIIKKIIKIKIKKKKIKTN